MLVQPLTLISSSFVEEEHQYWYHILPGIIVIWSVDFFSKTSVYPTSKIFLLVLLRIARSWNQTGVKWADQPGIREYINYPGHQWMLILLMVISFALVIVYFVKDIQESNANKTSKSRGKKTKKKKKKMKS